MLEIFVVSTLLFLKFGLEKKYNIKIGYIEGGIIASLIILSIASISLFARR